jgi:hypothetical protein
MSNEISNLTFMTTPEAAASFHDRGVVILHTGQGRLFTSNQTGASIWRGLEQKLSVDVIAHQICGEYQIELNTAREHTFNFVVQLERHALIQREIVS